MTRRSSLSCLALAAALLGVTTLASCSTTGTGGDAAKVGDHVISQDEFQSLLGDLAELSIAKSALATDAEGTPLVPATFTGDFARGRLSAWITTEAMADDLAARGKSVTDAQRGAAEQQLEQQLADDWTAASPRARQHLVDITTIPQAFSDSYSDPAAAQATYEQGISASGVACVAHILVATEDEAKAVEDELAAGADFATVAAEKSTDTGSGQNGGVLTDQSTGSPCSTADAFSSTYVPEFVTGALTAKVGVPTAPVKSEFGYHIIIVRPYDDVADVVEPILAQATAQPHLAKIVGAAKITVASRYGHWDPQALDVVAEL